MYALDNVTNIFMVWVSLSSIPLMAYLCIIVYADIVFSDAYIVQHGQWVSGYGVRIWSTFVEKVHTDFSPCSYWYNPSTFHRYCPGLVLLSLVVTLQFVSRTFDRYIMLFVSVYAVCFPLVFISNILIFGHSWCMRTVQASRERSGWTEKKEVSPGSFFQLYFHAFWHMGH